MLMKSCRKCGKPGKALCDSCRGLQTHSKPTNPRYREAEYIKNRRIMIDNSWAYGIPCCICGKGFGNKSDITAEHIVSLRHGGTNELSNLGPAHRRCNLGRHKPAYT